MTDSDRTLQTADLLLKSVTGEPLDIIGTSDISLTLTPTLSVTHRFLVVRNLQPYEAIVGLDFLSHPRYSIRHDLANFLLHVQGNPIRLFDAKRDQPCSTLTPVTAVGRHQYLAPHAITFVKVQVREDPVMEKLPTSSLTKTDYVEFHPRQQEDGDPRILGCVFDAKQIREGPLLVGVINDTHVGRKFKNGEALGFLTRANTQPHSDLIASIENEQLEEQQVSALTSAEGRDESREDNVSQDGRRPRERRVNPGKDPPSAQKSSVATSKAQRDFLNAFQYGNLDPEQLKRVQSLLLEYRDCFAMETDPLGLCTRITHDIKTTTDDPVVSQPYRVPKALEPEVKRMVQKMLDQNLIRKSNSEYSSPVVLVEKPDKSLRFCVNYQKLNAVSKKRTFPLPNPNELLAKIGENQPVWFSTSDLAAAFHQVPIKEEDKHKTAFVLPWAKLEWNVLAMGIAESAFTFARLGTEIFDDMLADEGLVLFIDDLCMYSPTFDHHLKIWRNVLDRLRINNLKLKPSKTHLFSTSGLKFLGHHVGPEGIAPNPAKLSAISEYPTPKTVKDIRGFVALCSFFRKNVRNFSKIAAPLNAMTRKGIHFKWTEECEAAFVQLKAALTNSDVLAYPQFRNSDKRPFILATDASDRGLGGWISQENDDGERKPIAFYSRSLNKAEGNYSTIEKEALAIVACIQAFHYYLHGRYFILESDHAPLKYVLSHAQKGRVQNTRLERWKLALQGLNMDIRHVAGARNIIPDSLSRAPAQISWKTFQQSEALDDPDIGIGIAGLFAETSTEQTAQETSTQENTGGVRGRANHERAAPGARRPNDTPQMAALAETPTDPVQHGSTADPPPDGAPPSDNPPGTTSDLQRLQRADPLWQPLISILEGKPTRGNITVWKSLPSFHLNDENILCYQPDGAEFPRVVIPAAMVSQLISECHSHPMAGHYHDKAVLDRLKRQYYWPSMTTDVQSYCKSCVSCHSAKTNRRTQPAKLGVTPPSYGPWETVHTDLVGPLPETNEGFRWILLIVCAFTKFVELIPLKDTTAETVAQALVGTFFRMGLPFHLVSDNGPQYRAKLLAEINRLLGVRHIFISAYHSQANSNVERMCGVVKSMITTSLNRTQREWHVFLGASQYAVNSTIQASNKWSPAFLMFGRHFRLPIEQALGAEPSPNSAELDDLVTQLRERQFDAITQVIDNQRASRSYQRSYYDRKAKERSYEVGDRVYRYNPATRPGNAAKLTKKWEPGYVIVGRNDNGLTYEVRKPGSRKPPEKVHCNRLKPQPVSQMYREGQESGRVFKRTGATSPARQRMAGPNRDAVSEQRMWEETTEPELPRRYPHQLTDQNHLDTGNGSGVTDVLEAIEGVHSSYSSPDEEYEDESSEDEIYSTVPEAPRRPTRERRPPTRYTP